MTATGSSPNMTARARANTHFLGLLNLERWVFRLNRHPGLDPGSIFLNLLKPGKKGGCRIKSGMTKPDESKHPTL
jgi:hypothetical protein